MLSRDFIPAVSVPKKRLHRWALFALVALAPLACKKTSSGPSAAPQNPRPEIPELTGPEPILIPPNAGRWLATAPKLDLKLGEKLKTASFMLRICVGRTTTVDKVEVTESSDPASNDALVAQVKGWSYKPYQVKGEPKAFCHALRAIYTAGGSPTWAF